MISYQLLSAQARCICVLLWLRWRSDHILQQINTEMQHTVKFQGVHILFYWRVFCDIVDLCHSIYLTLKRFTLKLYECITHYSESSRRNDGSLNCGIIWWTRWRGIYPAGPPFSSDSSWAITAILLNVQTVIYVIRARRTPQRGAHPAGTFHIQAPLTGSSCYNASLKELGWRTMKCCSRLEEPQTRSSAAQTTTSRSMTLITATPEMWRKAPPREHQSEAFIYCRSCNDGEWAQWP